MHKLYWVELRQTDLCGRESMRPETRRGKGQGILGKSQTDSYI